MKKWISGRVPVATQLMDPVSSLSTVHESCVVLSEANAIMPKSCEKTSELLPPRDRECWSFFEGNGSRIARLYN